MLDTALQGLIDANSEEHAERGLESLLEDRIAPLVRTIVARKLSAYGPSSAFRAEDLEDVAGDTILVLVKRLRGLRTEGGAGDIESLDDYTAAVTYSVCAAHLRRRNPDRSRLKNRLRYVLGRSARFALWQIAGAGLHGGLSRWRGENREPAASEALAGIQRERDRWPPSWTPPSFVDRADPAPLLGEIFTRVGCPIELDRLVGLVAAIWQIDRVPRSDTDLFDRLADPGAAPDITIDQRRLAERVWAEIQLLPPRQRLALLLNLRDGQGAGMLWMFPVTGIASMRAIADVLEMSAHDLATLWNQLPIDDNALAARLGCTRQQVINLRMSARKRLNNRIENPESPKDSGKGQANLRGLSVSMGSDT